MTQKKIHEKYMRYCLQLANNGRGFVSPNPMVGSIVVHNDKIIGQGWHREYGKAHAEVNAINSVKDKSLLSESTLYVNLEPCSHVGKTPACSSLIIEKKIPHVVIGCSDSFKEVNGKGIAMLRKAGIKVTLGVLEEESRKLNARFFTFHEKKRPYIILKWAQTSDGFIDFNRNADTPIGPNWITDDFARIKVHKWRSEEDAILVATNTAQKDNPSLNVRDYAGNHPVRIVLDRNLRLPQNLNLFDNSIPTLVFSERQGISKKNCKYITVNEDEAVFEKVLKVSYAMGLQSLIIEGGAEFLNHVISKNLWDEARIFIGDKQFISGIKAPRLNKQPQLVERGSNSNLYFAYNDEGKID